MPRDSERHRQSETMTGAPQLQQQDWSALEGEEIATDEILETDLAPPSDHADLAEEEDDNPFQESDEALPDDAEEAAIARSNADLGESFDKT